MAGLFVDGQGLNSNPILFLLLQLQNFLESDFLTEQVEVIKQLADWSAVLTRVQTNTLGWTIFDQELYEGKRS